MLKPACVSRVSEGFVCPSDLPPVPGVGLVCAKGCYLLSVDKAKETWAALEKVKLIDGLQEQIADLQLQRDTAIDTLDTTRADIQAYAVALQGCQSEADGKYALSTVFYVGLVSLSAGVLAALALTAF